LVLVAPVRGDVTPAVVWRVRHDGEVVA